MIKGYRIRNVRFFFFPPKRHRLKVCSLLAATLALFAPVLGASPHRSVDLRDGWEFRQVTPGVGVPEWHKATVPGVIHLDLLANHLIPDPYYRDNEAKLQWIQQADWEYRKTLQADSETLTHQHVELVFDGVDSAADVYLNDQPLLHVENAFQQFRVDVRGLLKLGANQIRVVFPSPDKSAAVIAAKDPWRIRTGTAEKVYVRKPAYEYGWDWGPKFVTSGIWKPVHLETWDEARIENVWVRQQGVSNVSAHVNVIAEVIATRDGPARITVHYGPGTEQKQVVQNTVLRPGANQITVPVDIDHPQLWFPAGYGAQPIYQFNVELFADQEGIDSAEAKTGLRTVELHRELDKWGRSFEFRVNGIPVYAKGADVIPLDSFPDRVKTADYRKILEAARDANMNMIRHWGGGYYEAEEFYDICDELGLMVWQDFMFGNEWQPGTYAFKQSVEAEAEYQVRRLRNHPSIVLWSGNNETEVAYNWNHRTKLPADVRVKMWEDYLTVFSGILSRVVSRLEPEIPYWPSSPSSDYEPLNDEYFSGTGLPSDRYDPTKPHFESGDAHDWDVWHGRVPFIEYEKHHWRFVSEYGFQSFPELRTVESFTLPEDRTSIFTPVMLAHQKSGEGDSLIQDYISKDYPKPKDFASFLYVSQVAQAEGVKIGAEHFRRSRPETMGSIFWQLNDCWPVASWSSIDYFGRWKALQYYARRFYAPILVSPHVEDGALTVYVVSDKTVDTPAELRLRIMNAQGSIFKEVKQAITIPALTSSTPLRIPLSQILNARNAGLDGLYAFAELTVDGVKVSSNLKFLGTPLNMHLPKVQIATDLRKSEKGYSLTLQAPSLARSVYTSFGELDVTYSDNYFDMVGGEPVTIQLTTDANLEQLKSALKVVSLADAFSPLDPQAAQK